MPELWFFSRLQDEARNDLSRQTMPLLRNWEKGPVLDEQTTSDGAICQGRIHRFAKL